MTNIDTVKGIYEAFGRGDIPWILEQLAEDVVWEYGMVPNGVPWLEPRRGRKSVAGFFQALAENLEFRSFSVPYVAGAEGVVVALADVDCIVKRSGKRLVENHEAHIWHFGADGKVAKFRHAADTYGHVKALQG
jgi:ketosteroid isomerase-like protein